MVGQFGEMEGNQSFYEQKCFRLLGNVYIRLLEDGEFDLSSMVAGEMATLGLTAIEEKNNELVDIVIIRFNTLLRFAIKHGVRNNEPRNLYNLGFYYGNFVKYLVEHKMIDHVKRCFMYLRIYGVEIFKHGSNSPAMYFIVDVIATEMKKVLEQIYKEGWPEEIQNGMLSEMLLVDSPPDFNKEDMARGVLINNGVRVLQFGLALFYQREGMNNFVDRIAKDVLDDIQSADFFFSNGYLATCYRNDEHMLTEYYSDPMDVKLFGDGNENELWELASANKLYTKEWPKKQCIDEEMITDILDYYAKDELVEIEENDYE